MIRLPSPLNCLVGFWCKNLHLSVSIRRKAKKRPLCYRRSVPASTGGAGRVGCRSMASVSRPAAFCTKNSVRNTVLQIARRPGQLYSLVKYLEGGLRILRLAGTERLSQPSCDFPLDPPAPPFPIPSCLHLRASPRRFSAPRDARRQVGGWCNGRLGNERRGYHLSLDNVRTQR
jgi:hypothetical protein